MTDDKPLSKKERKALLRQGVGDDGQSGSIKKILIGLLILIVLGGGAYWLFKGGGGSGSNGVPEELLGEEAADLGRDHVTDIFGVEYSSNPPTSGPHFAIWAKKGKYDRLISDGYLIHSLEHGYVVISYDCTKSISNFQFPVSNVLAHDEPSEESPDSGQLLMHMKLTPSPTMSAFTPENPPEVEVSLPEEFNNESCKNLESQLTGLVNYRERVIVVPRINMDKPIAGTAWGRIMKLDSFDQSKLEAFIAKYHNKGPEKTVE